MKKQILSMTVKGDPVDAAVAPSATLLEVLRDQLGLYGVKEGCSEGVCGACTVLMDGRPVRSCITLALEAEGASITTIEGVTQDGTLDPVQEAFIANGAVQCGFCTPGMVLSAVWLLETRPKPSREEIRTGIAGNLCRCSGYRKIIDAIAAVGGGER